MATYTIKDLERLSNVKAHTIRIWEQRYGLLRPGRTDTNIRYYEDNDLKKLLNVCVLMNSGRKVSDISKLNAKQLSAEIEKLVEGGGQPDRQVEAIVSQTLSAALTYDEALFEKAFAQALLRFGLPETYRQVIYPLLTRTGLMWAIDELLPSQEHFLSNLIRQKLFAAIDSLHVSEKSGQTWVLFLNEEEDHEIGLLFAGYVLRQKGHRVIYMGARVPYSNLADVVKKCRPTHLYTFFVCNSPASERKEMLKKLRRDFKTATLCVSGREELLRDVVTDKQIRCIAGPDDL